MLHITSYYVMILDVDESTSSHMAHALLAGVASDHMLLHVALGALLLYTVIICVTNPSVVIHSAIK